MDSTYIEKATKNGIHEEVHETDVSSETLTIDPEIERRCWRKFDVLVMPQLAILVTLGYLDRSNIGKLSLFPPSTLPKKSDYVGLISEPKERCIKTF